MNKKNRARELTQKLYLYGTQFIMTLSVIVTKVRKEETGEKHYTTCVPFMGS